MPLRRRALGVESGLLSDRVAPGAAAAGRRAASSSASSDIVIDAKSGISGAGKAPSERTHFCENHGSVAAYGAFGHRHTPEMEQALGRCVTFVPHLVPLDRGLLSSNYVRLEPGTTAAQLAEAFEQAYAAEPFVRVTGTDLPEIKHVAWSNFCDIGWKVDEGSGRALDRVGDRQPREGRRRICRPELQRDVRAGRNGGTAVKRRRSC